MSQQENTPKYIKQVPWYAQSIDTNNKKLAPIPQQPALPPQIKDQWYDRGQKGHQAIIFRKGACDNCGAMGHNRKQCTQRPRRTSAKFSTKNIAADDLVKNLQFSWESKRDRWNGYNPQMYKEVIQQYEEFEQIRKKKRIEQGSQDPDQQYKQSVNAQEMSNLPTKHAKNKKFQGLTGVRNRQDFAKYLLNLDANSDHFDPKSRSMRSYDNVAAQLDNLNSQSQRQQLIQQNNFAADQVQLNHSQLNSSALPTMTQKIYNTYRNKTNNQTRNMNSQNVQKYGVTNNNNNRPLDIIEQDENYYEYADEDGTVLKNNIHRKPIIKSRYEEDIIINDHTSIFGSWYNKYLGWGYKCCHSTEKYSYCLLNKGKEKALVAELKIKAEQVRRIKQLEELQQLEQQKQQEKQKEQMQNNQQKEKGVQQSLPKQQKVDNQQKQQKAQDKNEAKQQK